MTFIIIILITIKLLVIITDLMVIGIVIDFKNYNILYFYKTMLAKARAPP